MSELTPRTWDGLEIAAERPQGSVVVVRRPAANGLDYLALHRNARGADFEGDWAWTCPAGARQPGESVYPAALRELAEEAGLTDVRPWAVDLSTDWATFAIDVSAVTAVQLVDPEHDRYAWLSPDDCLRRMLPDWVAELQITRTRRIPAVTVAFRPMRRDDLEAVVGWQQAPHVRRWFHGDQATLARVRERYGPRIDGTAPTRMWVIQLDGADVGYVQDYRVGDHDEYAVKTGLPEAVGIDYVIGEPDLVGRGVGTRVIWSYLLEVVAPAYPDAPAFVASPDHRNRASLRMLEKCGFTQGVWIDVPGDTSEPTATEIVCTLDRAHWLGA